MGLGGSENVPVQTIGHFFEYHLMRSCAKDEDGKNCYITQSSVLPMDFSCDWKCALAYYWNKHFYPYGRWSLGVSELSFQDNEGNTHKYGNDLLLDAGINEFGASAGWQRIQHCGYGNSTKAPFDLGLTGMSEDASLASTTSNSTNTTSTPVATVSGSLSSPASATSSSTPTSGASHASGFMNFGHFVLVASPLWLLMVLA